ncbi:MAG: hypothetical protein QNK03_09655 [Myxococcota bacterium]|nr:hypothetical protein [Myxococcota bacterium]
MPELQDAAEAARAQLLPLLDDLHALAREEGSRDQELFFARIYAGVRDARDPEDLAGPFLELSTSAFRGFAFSPTVTLLLDRVLAVAQAFSATLSATGSPH